jgi:large subunit ribosomal protein L25
MKLAVQKRTSGKKGENNKLRREGNIPAILYGMNGPGVPVQVKADEIKAILRNIKSGLLSTTVFELTEHGHGKNHKAIIKEIQYNVASYDVEHIDFAVVSEDKPVTVNVPILMAGVADCVGVKLGGFLRQVIRSVKVSCLPRHIPQGIVVDVREMNIGQSKTLADIPIPSTVKPVAKLTEVAVVVGKKAGT